MDTKTGNKANSGSIFSKIFAPFNIFARGDLKTKLSFLIMGFGCFTRKQFAKGLIFFGIEIIYLLYLINFGLFYVQDITTLGTVQQSQVWNEKLQINQVIKGDNSMLILLFSVLTILITVAFLVVYFISVSQAYKAQLLLEQGKKVPTFKEDLKSFLDENFHTALLSLPSLGVLAFTILPLIFMVLIAFTNFDRNHQPPGNLFTWVGFKNFAEVFWQNPQKSKTFFDLLGWTLTWAFFATFTNYILGMVLAIMINKKGIKFKGLWRTIFVMTIAVPQFVTLLLMSKILNDQGVLNVLLMQMGWISEPIRFLTDGTLAKISVIVVNIWVGVPYTMLITTGILLNIPADLYESAKIDGANAVTAFLKITLPYMLFVTTPYLITQFIGNINNFNVIFLLTGGNPLTLDYFKAGKTDLLITWLYKLTVTEQNFSLASTIGILVFIVASIFGLLAFNITSSAKKEEDFQ